VNIVSCADKGLSKVPYIEDVYKRTASIFVLDGNTIKNLIGLNFTEWISLTGIWIRRNTVEICDALIKMQSVLTTRGIHVLSDCPSYTTRATYLDGDVHVVVETSEKSLTIPRSTPTTTTADSTTTGEDVTTDVPRDIPGMPLLNTSINTGHTTFDISFDINGLAIKITIPLACFGIACVVIRLMWRRRAPRNIDLDMELTKMKPPVKKRTSPTPSTTSDIMFQQLATSRTDKSTTSNRRYHEGAFYF
jgi:hypothetical protein